MSLVDGVGMLNLFQHYLITYQVIRPVKSHSKAQKTITPELLMGWCLGECCVPLPCPKNFEFCSGQKIILVNFSDTIPSAN